MDAYFWRSSSSPMRSGPKPSEKPSDSSSCCGRSSTWSGAFPSSSPLDEELYRISTAGSYGIQKLAHSGPAAGLAPTALYETQQLCGHIILCRLRHASLSACGVVRGAAASGERHYQRDPTNPSRRRLGNIYGRGPSLRPLSNQNPPSVPIPDGLFIQQYPSLHTREMSLHM